MEFLIDRKFWNKVIKNLSSSTALIVSQGLDKDGIEERGYPTIKKQFLLEIILDMNFTIPYSYIALQFEEEEEFYEFLSEKQVIEIEKEILKLLIQNQGLSEKIKYRSNTKSEPEFIIEQLEPINLLEKGFVYLIRNEDIFKIGITDNLLRRFNQLKPDEVLNVVRCSNYESLEKELHKKFKKNRIPQTEYFRLNQNQVEQVNNEMTKGAEF